MKLIFCALFLTLLLINGSCAPASGKNEEETLKELQTGNKTGKENRSEKGNIEVEDNFQPESEDILSQEEANRAKVTQNDKKSKKSGARNGDNDEVKVNTNESENDGDAKEEEEGRERGEESDGKSEGDRNEKDENCKDGDDSVRGDSDQQGESEDIVFYSLIDTPALYDIISFEEPIKDFTSD